MFAYDSGEKNAKVDWYRVYHFRSHYRELPETEKKYWHPHTYEVLAGGLIGRACQKRTR